MSEKSRLMATNGAPDAGNRNWITAGRDLEYLEDQLLNKPAQQNREFVVVLFLTAALVLAIV